MGKLVVSLEGVVIKEVQLTKEKTTLGRRPYNDVVIDNLAPYGDATLTLNGGVPEPASPGDLGTWCEADGCDRRARVESKAGLLCEEHAAAAKAAPKPPRPSKPAPRQEQQELAPPPAPPPVFRLWEGAQPGDLTQQAREPRGMFAHVIGRVDGVLRPLCFHAEQRPEPWHPAEDREEICPLCARDAKRAKIRVRPPLKHSPTLPDRLVVQPLKTVCAADLLGGTDAPAKS